MSTGNDMLMPTHLQFSDVCDGKKTSNNKQLEVIGWRKIFLQICTHGIK